MMDPQPQLTMSLIEFIGFIIVLISLFFLFIKKSREEKYRKAHPEEFEEEEEEKKQMIREFLHSLDIEIPEEDLKEKKQKPKVHHETPPPPPPKKTTQDVFFKNYDFDYDLEHREDIYVPHESLQSRIERRKYIPQVSALSPEILGEVNVPSVEEIPSRVKKLVKRMDLQEMIILSEILGPPKARKESLHYDVEF